MVSIPACHAGDRGSIPRRGGQYFLPFLFVVSWLTLTETYYIICNRFNSHINQSKSILSFVIAFLFSPFIDMMYKKYSTSVFSVPVTLDAFDYEETE